MANMTFKANLLPNSDLGYSLGSSDKKWNIYGTLIGNADSATKLSNTPNNTTTFLRGDNTWSNTITDDLIIGEREVSTAPSSETAVNRFTIIPYYHTGGPWYIKSSDDSSNAFLKLFYGSSELIKIKHDGTFMNNLKASITGNAATATKATQDADSKDIRDRYFRVYNTSYMGGSGSVTVNDLATQGPAYGMISAATDNPGGAEGWVHVLNMAWGRTNASWNGQIALQAGSGAWLKYRATSGAIAGVAWKTVLDSSNYSSYTVTKTGSGASGSWGISITGSANTLAYASQLTTQEAIDGFLEASKFKVATFKTTDANNVNMASNDGMIISLPWNSTTYGAQIALDDSPTGSMKFRGKSTNWGSWRTVIHDGNYSSYAVTLTTAQTITGNKSWGSNGGGGYLNGSATNGGMNSILIGDDCWLGDCNNSGIIAVKSNNGTTQTGFFFFGSNGTDLGHLWYSGTGHSNVAFYGACWNDYAEMRNIPEANNTYDNTNERKIKLAGRCVREVGDDTMVLSTERMQPGCKIISDTFGFNIGETDDCKTPIAVSGRALVYIYEGRDAARQHIGQPVCSGPDGTVSIMTNEEYAAKGYCCVGTISAVPEYETWGSGNIQVDGRIWIYVR